MKYHECEQGDDQWHRLRCGRPTASLFHIMRASKRLQKGPDAGDWSDTQKNLAFKYAVERLTGEPLDDGFETYFMRRGHALEPVARSEYEIRFGVFVKRVGFCTTDDMLFGASLDGLIDDDGSQEIKCFVSPMKLRHILTTGSTKTVDDQVHGGLWITRRKWMDFTLYCPALKTVGKDLWVKRIYRDDNYIESLEADLIEFNRLIDSYEVVLRSPEMPTDVANHQSAAVVEKATRRIAAAVAAPPPAPPPASRFEALSRRIATAPSRASCDLILDGASDLDALEYGDLYRLAAQRFPVEQSA